MPQSKRVKANKESEVPDLVTSGCCTDICSDLEVTYDPASVSRAFARYGICFKSFWQVIAVDIIYTDQIIKEAWIFRHNLSRAPRKMDGEGDEKT